jgi:hypothetical protein
MPSSPSFLISSGLFASRNVLVAKNSCKASRLSIPHSFSRNLSHSVRPGRPAADGCAARRVSNAWRSRRNGRDSRELELRDCELIIEGRSGCGWDGGFGVELDQRQKTDF